MRHILLIFILSLIPLSAKAVIPLQLIAEVQLPANTAWDAQHFYDDSSVTTVWLNRRDTLFYDLGDGTGVHTLRLQPPDSIPAGFVFGHYEYLVIFKDSASQTLPSIAVSAKFTNGPYRRLDLAFTIDLITGETISSAYEGSRLDVEQHHSEQRVLQRHEVWPPLPAVTQKMFLMREIRTADYQTGIEVDSERNEITAYSVPSFERIFNRDSCSALATFPDAEQLEVVFAGGAWLYSEWSCDSVPDGYCYHNEHFRNVHTINNESVTVCSVVSTNENPVYLYCYPSVSIAAAKDESGGKYAIIDSVCYDANTGNVAWSDPTRLPAFAGLNYPTPDQQMFFCKNINNTFNVYEPATGILFDETSPFYGLFHHALNLSGKLGELVTYTQLVGQPLATVRFFRVFAATSPQNLIITYLPQHNYIWLAWDPVPGATAYRVCRMFDYNEVGNCDDVFTVTTTATQFTIDPNRPQEFYTVSAVFE